MDKSWIAARRTSARYLKGVKHFLQFAENNVPDNGGKFYCPCRRCVNMRSLSADEIYDHLVCSGFSEGYTEWIWHGELDVSAVSSSYGGNIENDVGLPMDSQHDASTSQGGGNTSTRTRGPTYMISYQQSIESGGQQRLVIHFDKFGRPTGERKDVAKFKSVLGSLAKTVDITINNWREIEEPKREDLWQHLLRLFDIQNPTKLVRDKVLQDIGSKARNFRTDLANRYLNPESVHFGKFPGDTYRDITLSKWEQFVANRQTDSFKERRTKCKESAEQNKHPHRVGRGGYRKVKDDIMKEKLEQRQLEVGGLDSEDDPPSPPARHEVWKRARMDPNGSYLSEETAEIVAKITQLVEDYSKGTFVPNGSMDILSCALPNPEKPGRLRGEEGTVGWKQYFGGTQRRNTASKQEMEELKCKINQLYQEREREREQNIFEREREREQNKLELDTVREELRAISSMLRQLTATSSENQQHVQREMVPEVHRIPSRLSAKSSSLDPLKNLPPEGLWCKLYLEQPTRVVARGLVYGVGLMLHRRQLPKAQAKVTVKKIISGEETTMVPYMAGEVDTLVSSINCMIAWPRKLVELETEPEEIQPPQNKVTPTQSKDTTKLITSESTVKQTTPREVSKRNGKQTMHAFVPKGQRSSVSVSKGRQTLGVSVSKRKLTSEVSVSKGKQTSEVFISKDDDSRFVSGKLESSTWDENMKIMYTTVVNMSKDALVHIQHDIMRTDFYFLISKQDLIDFLKVVPLDISIIRFWIWVLYDQFELQGKKTYRFLDPHKISFRKTNDVEAFEKERIRYVENAINDDSVDCWMAPYNAYHHWMLCVIVPKDAKVYWLDPLPYLEYRRDDIMNIINAAFSNLKSKRKRRYVQRRKDELQWVNVECPKQIGSFECGYFVMKMMYDIIEGSIVQNIAELFGDASPYKKEQIDAMRSLFCETFNSEYVNLTQYTQEYLDSLFS